MSMTNEQLLEDLKQYVDGRLSQTETSLEAKVEASVEAVRSDLSAQIADVKEALSHQISDLDAKVDTALEAQGEINHEVETRLTRLEAKAA